MPCRCPKTPPRVDNPALKRMSLAGVSSAWRPPLWLGLWGRLRCAPTPSHSSSQPIPSVRRPSFTFSVLVAVSSLADLGYLSRPSLPFVALSLSKGLSTSSLVFLFPSTLPGLPFLVYICTVLPSIVHCCRSFLLDYPNLRHARPMTSLSQ